MVRIIMKLLMRVNKIIMDQIKKISKLIEKIIK